MAPLVRLVLAFRRAARASAPLGLALALGGPRRRRRDRELPLPYAVAAIARPLILFAARAKKRASAIEDSALLDLEIGLPLILAAYGLVLRLDGSLGGRFFALVYVCIGLVAAFARPAARSAWSWQPRASRWP
jgi:hypothetical protein